MFDRTGLGGSRQREDKHFRELNMSPERNDQNTLTMLMLMLTNIPQNSLSVFQCVPEFLNLNLSKLREI